jgi:hypothetical protein
MLEILLVFAVNSGPQEISDKIFYSYEECAEFVNTIAGMDVVNTDYGFRFIASDGMLFDGQCVEMKEWFLKKGRLEI